MSKRYSIVVVHADGRRTPLILGVDRRVADYIVDQMPKRLSLYQIEAVRERHRLNQVEQLRPTA